MRVAKIAVEAIRRKHGKSYKYGSSAVLLCKYLFIILRPLCLQFVSNNSHARLSYVVITFRSISSLNY